MQKPILFGKYYLLERINVGGMAEVFKAKAIGVEGFERLVAVKRILPNIAEDNEFIEMFIDEAKIAVQLTHANVAQIFDLGRVGDSYYIALEYVHGKDLRAVFNRARNRGEPVSISLACFVTMKVCEALDYAHNKKDAVGKPLNFVHRDVSPQNVLISYDGEVKVIDFGIAKAAGKASKTRAGILKGKFGYMSPEQVKGMDIDRRSDVFGVGICLYELLTGERLFSGESDFSTVEKVRKVDIMPPSTYNRRIPEELEQIVLKALAGEVEERYQTAAELHDELESFTYTSGNIFNRKDLSAYMRKVFSEELAQESARDQKYQALMMSETKREDEMAPNAVASPQVFNLISSDSPRRAPSSTLRPVMGASPPQGSEPQQVRAPYQRFNTLTGIPSIDQGQPRQVSDRGDASRSPEKPVVPPLIPRLQSIPPGFEQESPAADSGPFGAAWDDDDLSTQIYDKPERDSEDDLHALESEIDERATVPEPYSSNQQARARVPIAPSAEALPAQPLRTPAPSRSSPGVGSAQYHPPALEQVAHQNYQPGAQPPDVQQAVAQQLDLPDELFYSQRPSRRRQGKTPIYIAAIVGAVMIVAAVVFGSRLFVAQPDVGIIHLTTLPKDAIVKLDNRVAFGSTSPFLISNVTPNVTHLLEVTRDGYEPWSLELVLKPGEVRQLDRVTLRPARSGFTLNSDPPGAKVFVDGVELAQQTPVEVTAIAPGPHRIRVLYSDDYYPWEIPVNIVSGTVLELPPAKLLPTEPLSRERTRIRTPLRESSPYVEHEPKERESREKTAAIVLADGRLRINTRPWSEVFVDDKRIGNTPQMDIQLRPGRHAVTLVNPQFNLRKTISVDIAPGETTTKVIDLLPEPGSP
ncbi:MAG: protein kinase [Deltaproteobacteria bacterium]|nr:protein kinase [Deltaproteobacteria bacterium]